MPGIRESIASRFLRGACHCFGRPVVASLLGIHTVCPAEAVPHYNDAPLGRFKQWHISGNLFIHTFLDRTLKV